MRQSRTAVTTRVPWRRRRPSSRRTRASSCVRSSNDADTFATDALERSRGSARAARVDDAGAESLRFTTLRALECAGVGILLGIASAIFWGLGDFLITLLTRRIGTSRALIGIQSLSLV